MPLDGSPATATVRYVAAFLPFVITMLGAVLAGMTLLWLVSLLLRDSSIVDVAWGAGFAGIALLGLSRVGMASNRSVLLTALVVLWGLRLTAYLGWRNLGKGEDYRYQAMRERHGNRWWSVSLGQVFLLQGAVMWLVSLPVQLAQAAPDAATTALGVLDWLGVAVFTVGFLFEAVGDWQLARFKADPANAGQVMDRGLWRYTRHPNYFGDCCVWWGIWLVAASTGAGRVGIVGPIVMTFLLLRVSGVAMLERTITERRPGYADYIARTSAFVPWFPRTSETE